MFLICNISDNNVPSNPYQLEALIRFMINTNIDEKFEVNVYKLHASSRSIQDKCNENTLTPLFNPHVSTYPGGSFNF